MTNIVYLMNHLAGKGPVRVLYDICKGLDRKRYNPIIVTLLAEKPDVSIASKFKDLDIEIRCIHTSYFQVEIATRKIAKAVEYSIKDLGPCLIHPHCYHPTIVTAQMKGYRTITTIHNISIEDFTMKHGKLMGSYLSWRFRRDLKKIDCAVALSDYMKAYYKGCSNNLIRIYNGVDFNNDYTKDHCKSLRKQMGFVEDKKIIVVSGSITPRKNPLYIISHLIKSKRTDFVCTFIGSGILLEECKKVVDGDPRFRFEGQVSNVSDYLAIADLLISASKSEGLPLGILEACYMGVPMLISNIPPHKEIADAIHDRCITMIDCEKDELSTVFDQALSQKYDTKQFAEKTRKIFGADIMAKKYMEEYEKLNKRK